MREDIHTNESPRFDIKIAGPSDWQAYRDLRIQAVHSKDSLMLGERNVDEEKRRAEDDSSWQKDVARGNPDIFIVLAREGPNAVGMSIAKREKGAWHIGSAYVAENVRDQGINTKMFALRLKEILRRGGKDAEIGIRSDNAPSLHIARDLFKAEIFRQIEKDDKLWYFMVIDLAKPEVIKKIKEVLNAG